MTGPQAVGVGLCMLDELLLLPRYPDADRESAIHATGYCLQGGGPAATAMVAAARLGARAGLLAKVGEDDRGRRIVGGLRDAGVDTSRLVTVAGGRSALSIVCVHAPTGRRSFLIDADPAMRLQPGDLDRDYVASAAVVLIDSFTPAGLAAAACARDAGRTVVFDAAGVPADRALLGEALALTDVMIVSAEFARKFHPAGGPADAAEAIRRAGPPVAVVTGGPEGAWLAAAGESFHQGAFEVDVVDTTGAGDVFHGAFLIGLLESWPLRRTCAFAAASAALACRALGGRTAIPDRAEVEALLRARPT